MISKEHLKAQIPHGKHKTIAEKAGVSPAAVTKYFDGKTKSSFRIQKAALEVALECKESIQPLEQKLID